MLILPARCPLQTESTIVDEELHGLDYRASCDYGSTGTAQAAGQRAVTMKSLLEAGVHFWAQDAALAAAEMKSFIFHAAERHPHH